MFGKLTLLPSSGWSDMKKLVAYGVPWYRFYPTVNRLGISVFSVHVTKEIVVIYKTWWFYIKILGSWTKYKGIVLSLYLATIKGPQN
jgi:hypothetical protein